MIHARDLCALAALASLVLSLLACGDDTSPDDDTPSPQPTGYRGERRACGGASWSATVALDASGPLPARTYRAVSGQDRDDQTCWHIVHTPQRVALFERIERDGQLVGYCVAQGRPAPFRATITDGQCAFITPSGSQTRVTLTGGDIDLSDADGVGVDLRGQLSELTPGEALFGEVAIRLSARDSEDAPFPADLTPPLNPSCPAYGTCQRATTAAPTIVGEPLCAEYAAQRIGLGGALPFDLSPDGATLTQDQRALPAATAVDACRLAAWEGAPPDLWRYTLDLDQRTATLYHERTLAVPDQDRFITCQITWPATLEGC